MSEVEFFVRDIQFDSPQLHGKRAKNEVDVAAFFVFADGFHDIGLEFDRLTFDAGLDEARRVNLVSFA